MLKFDCSQSWQVFLRSYFKTRDSLNAKIREIDWWMANMCPENLSVNCTKTTWSLDLYVYHIIIILYLPLPQIWQTSVTATIKVIRKLFKNVEYFIDKLLRHHYSNIKHFYACLRFYWFKYRCYYRRVLLSNVY